jgi:hypothetical protein
MYKIFDIYIIMPYSIRGKCIYKQDTGKKVGCTKGSITRYLSALHANVSDAKKNEIRTKLKEFLKKLITSNSIIDEDIDMKKNNSDIRKELSNNFGLKFEQFEIDKIKEIISPVSPNLENPSSVRGHELSFSKDVNGNNFYFVIKKLINKSDSSSTSMKYGIWYIKYENEDDYLKEPIKSTTVYYRLSDPIDNLIKDKDNNYTLDQNKKAETAGLLYNFMKKSMNINL